MAAYTSGSAYVNHRDDETGSIRPGYLADLVVLDPDPFSLPADQIHRATVTSTWIDGALVHSGNLRPRTGAVMTRSHATRRAAALITGAADRRPRARRHARRRRRRPTRRSTGRSPTRPRRRPADIDSFSWVSYAEPYSLDYAYAFDYADNQVLANVCESLLRLNPDYSLTPGLAESFAHPTPTTWVYSIRDGVTFHDGTPLTADDVVVSMSRHLDPAVGSSWYSVYQNVVVDREDRRPRGDGDDRRSPTRSSTSRWADRPA